MGDEIRPNKSYLKVRKMEKQKCQICGTENIISEIECVECYWPISADTYEIKEERMVKWATQIYKSWFKYRQEIQKVRNQSTSNSNINPNLSAIEKSLQFLLDYQKSQINLQQEQVNLQKEQNRFFKILVTEVSERKEKFSSSNHVYPDVFEQAQNQEIVSNRDDVYGQPDENNNQNIFYSEIRRLNDSPESVKLVENYNSEADFIDKVEVAETEDSKEKRRGDGIVSSIILEQNNRGNYWVIDQNYLVPKHKKFTGFPYKTLSTLFECRNNEQSLNKNFLLIKPAKVIYLNDEAKWQLEERGIIEFL